MSKRQRSTLAVAMLGVILNISPYIQAGTTIEFRLNDERWRCDLVKDTCAKVGPLRRGFFGRNLGDDEDEDAAEGAQERTSRASPDDQWEAIIENFNVFLRPKNKSAGR